MTTTWDVSLDGIIAKLERAKEFETPDEAGIIDEAEALGQAMLASDLLSLWIEKMMEEGY